MKVLQALRISALIVLSLGIAQPIVYAQSNETAQDHVVPLAIRDSDRKGALSYSDMRVHVLPRHKAEGTARNLTALPLSDSGASVFTAETGQATEELEANSEAATALPRVPAPGFYPADVAYHGGALLKSVQSNNVYVNGSAGDWGAPRKFLIDFGKSTFVHTLDQYVGETANNRYTAGIAATLPYPTFATLGDNDLLQIVHSAASTFGSGYGHIYHVFLPKGVDFCEPDGSCYSPDNLSTFAFCAFHGSVTFSDIGHVILSLEPYQNVDGCATAQPSPNGALIDSTNDVLSHELSEAISDPDPPTGWYAQSSLGTFGQEIGDLCPGIDLTGPFFKNPISVLNGRKYEIQLEYSNKYHACANVP